MKVIDLSHLINKGMPVFPGTEKVIIKKTADIEPEGYNELKVCFSTHTGTHIDCGQHFIRNGLNTSTLPVERFIGNGLVIDCKDIVGGGIITKKFLEKQENQIGKAEFLLFHTGWSRYWGSDVYFNGFHFLETDAAIYLKRFHLKGIGIDAASFDPSDSHDFPVHKILLEQVILIENLVSLDKLPRNGFIFCCFPLKIENGDGSPVRAVGIVESDD